MPTTKRYPLLHIRSKNELAKHIHNNKLSTKKALALINEVTVNFDDYWKDSNSSEPEKGKFVRSAVGTPLGQLVKNVDKKVLKPHDHLVPDFIFGGLSGRNHVQAAHSLLGRQRDRTILKLDITRFFEQITRERVFHLFHKKCDCSAKAADLIASLCCVPTGEKDSGSETKTLARGFATSPRLAVWTNLDTFVHLKWKVCSLLKGHDPRIVIFVDDVGIAASRVEKGQLEKAKDVAEAILTKFDPNQSLPLNETKTDIRPFSTNAEHLGLRLGRNKVSMNRKSRSKRKHLIKKTQSTQGEEKKKLGKKGLGYIHYQHQIDQINNSKPKHKPTKKSHL